MNQVQDWIDYDAIYAEANFHDETVPLDKEYSNKHATNSKERRSEKRWTS